MEKRGGLGAGGPNTFTDTTLTGPPSSTHTKDRHIHPNIKGSTGGFIGLIVGIAVVVILGVFAGFWLYNRRRRRRLLAGTARPGRLGISALGDSRLDDPWDPYADPLPSPHDGGNRPMYARAKSEEWEIPQDTLHTPRPTSPFSAGRGLDREDGVNMPEEPGETTAPIRSRSPRLSPRMFDRELPVGDKGKGRAENPFESDLDPGRLSPRIGHREF